MSEQESGQESGQVSEQEKEAIRNLKHYISITPHWKLKEYTFSEIDNYIKINLNYIDKLQKENEELQDLKAELHAEVIKNHYLEDKVKVYEQQIDLEWVEENYIEKRILKRAEKIIDLMAEQMSKRPLMIFQGNENLLKILKEPKEIIDYYTKKAEE